MKAIIKKSRRFLVIFFSVFVIAPLVSAGEADLDRDWYCSEPDAHTAQYESHLQKHIDHGAKEIATKLETVFSDQSLSKEEKLDKTVGILNRYLGRAKAGIGD